MKPRNIAACAAALAVCVAVVSAAIPSPPPPAAPPVTLYFTWTDGGSGHRWDNEDNWDCPTPWPTNPCGYPSNGANALFPYNSGTPWECIPIDGTIGILSIEESLTFTEDSDTVTLSADQVYIDASEGDIDIEVTGAVVIEVPQE